MAYQIYITVMNVCKILANCTCRSACSGIRF